MNRGLDLPVIVCDSTSHFIGYSNRTTLEQKVITLIPLNRNGNLVNRDDNFKALDQLFTPPSHNQPIAIWAIGGCGYVEKIDCCFPMLIYIQ
jgi:hypothetical protein